MKRMLNCCALLAALLAGCAAPPRPSPASNAVAPTTAAAGSPDASEAKAFGQCKRAAATRNLPLAQHQEALFECARRHAGKRGEACLGQLILNKTRVSDLEQEMAHCLRGAPKA